MELKNIDTNLDNDERYLFTNISTSNKMEEELEETNINISSDNKLKKEKNIIYRNNNFYLYSKRNNYKINEKWL